MSHFQDFQVARAAFCDARAEHDSPHVWDDVMDHAHDFAADRHMSDEEWSEFLREMHR